MKAKTVLEGLSAARLLQVADYLSRPQQFLAVAEAQSGLRQALEDASEHSVVLTNNGQPQAAIVPFETLEAMRGAAATARRRNADQFRGIAATGRRAIR